MRSHITYVEVECQGLSLKQVIRYRDPLAGMAMVFIPSLVDPIGIPGKPEGTAAFFITLIVVQF